MYYKVDKLKKKKIQKDYIKASRWAPALSKGFLLALVLFTAAFWIYGFAVKDTFLMMDVTDSAYGQKNTLLVWTVLVTVDIILAFFWCIQRIVVNRIFGKYISQRVNESLVVADDRIEYGYQNAVAAIPGDRVIVKVPICRIKKITVNKKIGMVEFTGQVSSKYYDNYPSDKTRVPENSYKEGTLVLFDYFSQNILEYFKHNCSHLIVEKATK